MSSPDEQKAIAALYERHGHALYRRALSLTGSAEDAQELVQETFCQFWRGRRRFEFRSTAFTYLYRITTNLAIDRLRRRTTAGDQTALKEDGMASQSSTDRVLAAASELAQLTSGLAPDVLVVAVLSHVDGMTQEEIAASLSVSRRTVGKRLRKFENHTRLRAEVAHG